MVNVKGVIGTKQFGAAIKKLSAEEHDELLHALKVRTVYFESLYKQAGPLDFVKAFYDLLEEVFTPLMRSSVSCKRGCHFCCRQNVEISEAEAMVIAEYCQEHGIDIPRKYLEEQLKYERKDVARTVFGWCTFLTEGGECSIYAARPVACRNYHVSSPPEQCDVVRNPPPNNRVVVSVYTIPELEVSAFYGMMKEEGKSGRLPELLLPYSK